MESITLIRETGEKETYKVTKILKESVESVRVGELWIDLKTVKRILKEVSKRNDGIDLISLFEEEESPLANILIERKDEFIEEHDLILRISDDHWQFGCKKYTYDLIDEILKKL